MRAPAAPTTSTRSATTVAPAGCGMFIGPHGFELTIIEERQRIAHEPTVTEQRAMQPLVLGAAYELAGNYVASLRFYQQLTNDQDVALRNAARRRWLWVKQPQHDQQEGTKAREDAARAHTEGARLETPRKPRSRGTRRNPGRTPRGSRRSARARSGYLHGDSARSPDRDCWRRTHAAGPGLAQVQPRRPPHWESHNGGWRAGTH